MKTHMVKCFSSAVGILAYIEGFIVLESTSVLQEPWVPNDFLDADSYFRVDNEQLHAI